MSPKTNGFWRVSTSEVNNGALRRNLSNSENLALVLTLEERSGDAVMDTISFENDGHSTKMISE